MDKNSSKRRTTVTSIKEALDIFLKGEYDKLLLYHEDGENELVFHRVDYVVNASSTGNYIKLDEEKGWLTYSECDDDSIFGLSISAIQGFSLQNYIEGDEHDVNYPYSSNTPGLFH